jgi:ABC-type sugar transport system substrate-binding protein
MSRTPLRAARTWPAIAAVAALALAGCSTSSSNSTAGSSGAKVEKVTAVDSATIVAAAKASASAAGDPTTVDAKMIGIIHYGANGPADIRATAGLTAATKAIGWKTTECDGQGDPVKQGQCATGLVNQGVDAIITIGGIPQSAISAGQRAAQAKKIPFLFTTGTTEPNDLYTTGYYPDEATLGSTMADWLSKSIGDKGNVVMQTFPAAVWATQRVDAGKKVLVGKGVKVASTFEADATSLVPATQTAVGAALNQESDVKAVWLTFSGSEPGAATALQTKFPSGTKPLLTSFYGNSDTLGLIRAGRLDAVVDDSLEWCEWVAVDQLAEFFARGTAMSKDARPDYGDKMNFWKPQVITKANVPAEGKQVTPPVDYVKFFTTKWSEEFGK